MQGRPHDGLCGTEREALQHGSDDGEQDGEQSADGQTEDGRRNPPRGTGAERKRLGDAEHEPDKRSPGEGYGCRVHRTEQKGCGEASEREGDEEQGPGPPTTCRGAWSGMGCHAAKIAYMVRYTQPRVRRQRNSITRDEIIRVALGICETEGAEALTMRAVAAAMDAAPMSLYNHMATKDELLDAVLDTVMGRLQVATDLSADWEDELVSFALALAEHLDTHHWAVLALMTRPDPGDRTTAVGEVAIAAALRGGLTPSNAVTAFAALLSLVYGRAAFLAAAARPGAQPAAEVGARISGASAAEYPATASIASELVGYASPVHLERAVRALVDGLARLT